MNTTIFALVDCNCFYVSCERVFHPAFKYKPTVVLSNNDGCFISRSNEAKKIGIPMAAPIYQCRDLIKQHNVKVFSANFALYGDMSNRVMSVLSGFTPNLEIYSIDEAFLSLDGFESKGLEEYGRTIRAGVYQRTGIPVSIGIAPTKTLAKVANHYAKDHPETKGVFTLMEEKTIRKYLLETPVREIWGIGKRKSEFLQRHGILNAWQLSNMPDAWIKENLSVVTLRTVQELRGIPCLSLEEVQPSKKSITTTRTFSQAVYDLPEMEIAIASYTSRCAEKLRYQQSLAGFVQVYVETHRFKENFYRASAGIDLNPPTAYTPLLIQKAKSLLKTIYREGVAYKGSGVLLTNLSSEENVQEYLFDEKYQGSRRERLMNVMDQVNYEHSEGKLYFAAEGLGKPVFTKQEHKSNRFTTRWDELLEIKVDP